MTSLVIDLILCGLTYVMLIYFMTTIGRKRWMGRGGDSNGGDGGISIESPPHIDLPPGVTWPDGSGGTPFIPKNDPIEIK
ncbi:hypothetical protein [Penaeicola halotolerans]|uniref:hypothetical protein n=1 Tax=Penaeicola halotolerans TaxID=2793196 RepID=UPI001CF91C42|nr:hypothetical protein [Penaeicola halotolerans]